MARTSRSKQIRHATPEAKYEAAVAAHLRRAKCDEEREVAALLRRVRNEHREMTEEEALRRVKEVRLQEARRRVNDAFAAWRAFDAAVAYVLVKKHGLAPDEARRRTHRSTADLFPKGRPPDNVELFLTVERIREANGGAVPDGHEWRRRATPEQLAMLQGRGWKPSFWDSLARQHNIGEKWEDVAVLVTADGEDVAVLVPGGNGEDVAVWFQRNGELPPIREKPQGACRTFSSGRSMQMAYAAAKRAIEGKAAAILAHRETERRKTPESPIVARGETSQPQDSRVRLFIDAAAIAALTQNGGPWCRRVLATADRLGEAAIDAWANPAREHQLIERRTKLLLRALRGLSVLSRPQPQG